MLLGNQAHHIIGDSRAGSQARQMELAHFSAAAHVMHQVKRIPFAADESHDVTSNFHQLV
jgi:hypothetical protein